MISGLRAVALDSSDRVFATVVVISQSFRNDEPFLLCASSVHGKLILTQLQIL